MGFDPDKEQRDTVLRAIQNGRFETIKDLVPKMGLNTTAVHAHGALYDVYGTLGLGLMLFCLRAMKPELIWKEKPIWLAFWAINIGMFLEIVLSLLPVGLMQTYESISVGYWSARSSEFMQTDLMQTLRRMRMVGDTIKVSVPTSSPSFLNF